MIKQSI